MRRLECGSLRQRERTDKIGAVNRLHSLANVRLLIEEKGVDEESGASDEVDAVDNEESILLVGSIVSNSGEEIIEYPFFVGMVVMRLQSMMISHVELVL